jgi:hypothetical protein
MAILALAPGTVPFPTATEPWCSAGDLTGCVADPGDIDLDSVCRVATTLLRMLSGRKYGIRRLTVRPRRNVESYNPLGTLGISPTPTGAILSSATGSSGWSWGQWDGGIGVLLNSPISQAEIVVDDCYLNPTFADGQITSGSATLTSNHAHFVGADIGRTISGSGIPLGATIIAVPNTATATLSAPATTTGLRFFTIGREPDWYLYDSRLLVRARTLIWPPYNDMSRPVGTIGTWGITYEAGRPVPEDAVMAIRPFACQLLKLVVGSDCEMPEWVTFLTRQGLTMTLDPAAFLDKGRTGVAFTDMWLAAVNPHRLRRRPRIASPDTIQESRQ